MGPMRDAGSPAGSPGTAGPVPGTVAAAMIRRPKVSGPGLTVSGARAAFRDDHVHALLVADGPTLLAVVERADLPADAPPDAPAREHGRLAGRTVGPDADLEQVWALMARSGRRRLAVVDEGRRLQGLLCLKRSERGFCRDTDVAARADEHGAPLPAHLGDPGPAAARPCRPR